MKMPYTDPALPRYYLGNNYNRGGAKGYFKPFDLNPTPSSPLRGVRADLVADARYENIPARFDPAANRGDFLNGLGEVATDPTTGLPTDGSAASMPGIGNFFTSLMTAYNTQRLTELNITRASQGLPPITAASVTPGVNVGLAPETMNTLLAAGAVGLGIWFIAGRRRRKH